MPKSRILISPVPVNIRFSGLMSRWMTPWVWATAIPATHSNARLQNRSSGTGSAILSRSVTPSTYSMTSTTSSSSSSTS